MSSLSSARRLGYLFTDFHDHENVGHARSKLLEKFRGGEESAKENLRTGQLHIDFRILKSTLQKFTKSLTQLVEVKIQTGSVKSYNLQEELSKRAVQQQRAHRGHVIETTETNKNSKAGQ